MANGVVQVNDWVRELPASHFQPCYCCLCRPRGGERPPLQVRGIVKRRDGTYLRLQDLGEVPAWELERVEPPPMGPGSASGATGDRRTFQAFLLGR